MKKLIIAAVIVCAAAISQAAAVDWKASASSSEKNYTVYIMSALSGSWADAAAVANDKNKLDSGTASGSRTVSAGGTVKGTTAISKSTETLYAVIVTADGSQYATKSFSIAGKVYDDLANPPETSPGTASFDITGLSYSSFGPGPDPTPEPTSAMLLLLGVAGLALKRKVA